MCASRGRVGYVCIKGGSKSAGLDVIGQGTDWLQGERERERGERREERRRGMGRGVTGCTERGI
jgi:hypothetical protein